MEKNISVWGIETNNLKSIDIQIEKEGINLIIGPSGSGKSSLAYDTIAQIGQHEFMSMFADNVFEPTYKIKGYENMMAAVPIKQTNFNNNTRSTIGTYFGINKSIILIYAALLELSEDFFVLNKEENLCVSCHGMGFTKVLDENRVVSYDVPLAKNPIRCWNRYKDFYSQIIQQFCTDNGIDPLKTFRQLSVSEKKMFLHGESEVKYSIRYKKSTAFSRRTTKYHGVMTEKQMMPNYAPAEQFFSDKICENCHGQKYAFSYEEYKVYGVSIGRFMTMPFEELQHHIERLLSETADTALEFALNNIYRFIVKANQLNLGYLFFHRAVPTLSGGELQRLRMVQVLNTQLSNLLLVLDEPLAGLSGIEKEAVYQSVLDLSKTHTIVIVDHSDAFVGVSKQLIALGEKSGIDGGYLINAKNYLLNQIIKDEIAIYLPTDIIHIVIHNQVYLYNGVDIQIGKNSLNLITGRSGIGKSTLLREYFPQFFEQYLYVNQKPLSGNKNSSVATALDLFTHISEMFSKKHKKDRRFFSNQTGCDGMCPVCLGSGYLEYGNGYDVKVKLECRECNGTGFNKNLKKYEMAGKNIFEIWAMTLDEAKEYFHGMDVKIIQTLEGASSLLLGHLKIGQPISTLSGGENIRIKLLKAAKSSAKTFGVDEPFKGLSNSEIFCVVQYLEQLRSKGKTIVVVDHTKSAERYFAKKIEIVNINHILIEMSKTPTKNKHSSRRGYR